MTSKFIRVAQSRSRSSGPALLRSVFAPFAALLLSLGCSDPDDLFTITENPPIPATAAAAVPFAKPAAPTDLCADIACCRERLDVAVDGPCASVSFIQGHCALVAAPDGTDCGSDDPCASTVGSCQAGQCQTAPGLPVDCSSLDGPCAVGVCDSAAGGCVATPRTGESCDDGDACTTGDVCADGESCVGSALDCDDDDPCTDDACGDGGTCTHVDNGTCADCKTVSDCPALGKCDGVQTCAEGKCQVLPDSAPCALLVAEPCNALECVPETGDCVQVPTTGACDDGDACTTDDSCDATGTCEGTALGCDDQNSCTTDSCAPDSGCTYAKTTGEACDDGNVCTTADACVDGTCSSVAVVCDDGLPCTDDVCEAGVGCVTTPGSGATCDDSDPCTANDVCVTGTCVGTSAECSCTVDSDCKNFDDGNVCNGAETCEAGTCVLSTPPLTCGPDGDLADCLAPACSPALGGCAGAPVADGGSCTDDDPCTSLDACEGGECKGTTILCDDGDQCTTDSCNPALGCVSTPSNAACDDDDACTVGEKCAGGQCAGGAAVDCDDGLLCTADSCSKKSGCKYSPVSGACDDGSACTSNDACLAGKCTGTAKSCPAGDLCAPSTCDPTSGQCKTSPKNCDDGSACTTDACDSNGECTHVPVTCTSPDACQVASCDPASGCKTTPKVCPDGVGACEVATCAAGVCGTTAKVCNDGDGCTTDSCDPNTGCKSVALTCTDGNACTIDACVAGQCKFTAIVCNDGNACTSDACSEGQCTTTPVVCNDGNACTTDSCDTAQGCKTAAIVCTDGIACTVDACAGGTCVFTPDAAACNDQDPCTTDSCTSAGCAHAFSTAACDDGDACTAGDTCEQGECKPATYTCGACVGKAEGEGCDDADSATVGDFCWKGWCRGFEKTLVPHASGGTLELNELTMSGGEFLAISTAVTSGNGATTTSTLGLISLDGDLDLIPSTASATTAWAAIADGVAVGDDLSVALDDGGNWSKGGWLATALGSLGVAEISAGDAAAVWRDSNDGLVWVAGRGLNVDAKLRAWIARCDEGTSTCTVDSTQYTDFSKVEVPRSMTGIPGSQVLMISDYPLSAGSTKFYSDAFARKSFSPDVKWLLDYFDQESSSSRSADVALTESAAFWVGTGGLLRVRAKNAANATFWTKLTGLWVNQDKAAFSGVWMDDSITLIASTVAVIGNTVELQLVTHPTATTASTAANWRRISLGTVLPTETCLGDLCAPLGDVAANLQDVYSDGENIVIVGWQVPSKGKRNAAIWVRRVL